MKKGKKETRKANVDIFLPRRVSRMKLDQAPKSNEDFRQMLLATKGKEKGTNE